MSASDTASTKPASAAAKPLAVGGGLLASVGALGGIGAACVSSVCAIPVLLGTIGAGSLAAVLPGLATYQTPILAASALSVAGGWGAYAWKRWTDAHCGLKRRSWLTLSVLIASTALVVAAFNWDAYFETPMMALLGQ